MLRQAEGSTAVAADRANLSPRGHIASEGLRLASVLPDESKRRRWNVRKAASS